MSNLIKLDTSLSLETLPNKKEFIEQGVQYVLENADNPVDAWILLKRMNDLTDDARRALEDQVAKAVTKLLVESKNQTVTYRGHKITLSQKTLYKVIPNKHINGLLKRRKEHEKELQDLMPQIVILQDSIKSLDKLIQEEKDRMVENNDPLVQKLPKAEQPKPQLKLVY